MKKKLIIFLTVGLVFTVSANAVSLANEGLKGKYSRSLESILNLEPDQIDLGTAALIISEQWSEFVYGRQYIRRLDEMATEIAEEIEDKNLQDSPRAINILNKYLFEQKGFESVKDANNPDTLLLHSVMDKKKGYCLSLSVLYLALSERVGVPVYGVVVPGHFFVRYDDGENQYNIETTSSGAITSDKHYIDKFDVPETDTIYMRNLNKLQVLGCFFNNLGNSYQCIDDYSSAMKALARAVRINPTLAESRINFANIYFHRNQYKKALEQYEYARQLNPQSSQARSGLANTYLRLDRPGKAIPEYKKTIELEPGNIQAYKNLAGVYTRLGEFAKAETLLNRAMVHNSDDPQLYAQMGQTLYKAGEFYDAIYQYQRSLNIEQSPQAYLGLAECYKETGDTDSRIEAYENAIRLDSDTVSALAGLGGIYFDRKDYVKAKQYYKRAVEIRGGESSLHHNLAACYSNNGEYELAEPAYKKAVELNPRAAGAHNGLAITYYNLQRYELALKHLETARELGYDIPKDLLEVLERKVNR
jgi:tetratricopeptide (TPR) repeat protein